MKEGINMKKIEAQAIALEKSNLVIEYLEQMLNDSNDLKGRIEFDRFKINGEYMTTLEIYVPKDNFERHFNLGITSQHCNVFYEQLLDNILDRFLDSSDISITRFYKLRGMDHDFNGITVSNLSNSKVDINFICREENFQDVINKYNGKINEYVNSASEENNRKGK